MNFDNDDIGPEPIPAENIILQAYAREEIKNINREVRNQLRREYRKAGRPLPESYDPIFVTTGEPKGIRTLYIICADMNDPYTKALMTKLEKDMGNKITVAGVELNITFAEAVKPREIEADHPLISKKKLGRTPGKTVD